MVESSQAAKSISSKDQTIFRGRAITSTPYGDTWQVDTLSNLHYAKI
jgi:hypothetical protein